jgi:Cep192 domain 4/Beta-propeller repeat
MVIEVRINWGQLRRLKASSLEEQMKRYLVLVCVICLAAAASLPVHTIVSHGVHFLPSSSNRAEGASPSQRAAAFASYGDLPISFEENLGQSDPAVKFLARGDGYTAFLTHNEAVLTLQRSPSNKKMDGKLPRYAIEGLQPVKSATAVVRIGLSAANPLPEIEAGPVQPGNSNYLIGNDPTRWIRKARHYTEIKYRGVYPGIDLVYHGNQKQLEEDFVLAPGADARKIGLRIKGVERLALDSLGNLVVATRNGDLLLRRPTAYQEASGKRVLVAANFVLREPGSVGIQVGAYDPNQPLIVDPVLDYSTLLGGGANPFILNMAVDSGGNAYVTGTTTATDFPTTNGAFLKTFPSGATSVAFVTKMNPTGTGLVFSTFLSGTGSSVGNGIAVDPNGNVFVTGHASSSDFPVTQNAYQITAPNGGAFVTELDPTGSTLLYSTYLAGTVGSAGGGPIALDANDNAYVLGRTSDTNFPITVNNAFQTSNNTDQTSPNKGTIFLSRIDPSKTGTGSLIYSTYLGGSKPEFPISLAVDTIGNAYLTGSTTSADFPTQNAYSASLNNQFGDIFLTRIDTTKSGQGSLIYSTYFGGPFNGFGNAYDTGGGIAIQPNSIAVVVGYTYANNGQFPLTANALDSSSDSPNAKAFLSRFDTTKAGQASLLYSTLWGGGPNGDLAFSATTDAAGNIYMVGATSDKNFPVTPGAPMAKFPGRECAFLTEFNPTGTTALFSTYWGGGVGAGNGAYSVVVDSASPPNAYFAGYTSSNFPTTPGAFQTTFKGTYDGFLVKMSPAAAQVVSASPAVVTFGNQVVSTAGAAQTVTLFNNTNATLNNIVISFTGADATDFSETNTCGSSPATLAALSQCSINVMFTPSKAQAESATLSISDSATGSPQTVPLSGTGTGVSVSPALLDFSNQTENTTSAAQIVTVTNKGTSALAISSISVTGTNLGNFPENNTCGTSVAAGGSCTISVSFAPTTPSSESATLQINDSDPSSPQIVSLTGTGVAPGQPNFSLLLTPAQGTVTAGGSSNFSVTVTSLNSFASAVSLSCSGAPIHSTCSLSPTSVTPAANSTVNSSGTITTTVRGLILGPSRPSDPYPLLWLCTILSLALILFAARIMGRRTARKLVWSLALLPLVALAGCHLRRPKVATGTPAGTYSLTVKGTSGTLSNSVTYTLTVN